jgi:hypothetical protein
MQRTRESRAELFRIILMFGIVLYHFILHAIPGSKGIPVLASLQTLLRVGVPCFVMLSGWFGIKPSMRGIIRFWSMCFVYSILLFLLSMYLGFRQPTALNCFAAVFPILFSHAWWFPTIYISLYIVSPVLESFLNTSSDRKVFGAVAGLFFLSFYVGHGPHNGSFAVGKNLCHFMMLYMIGRLLRRSSCKLFHLIASPAFVVAFSASSLIAALILIPLGRIPARIYEELFDQYNSPYIVILSMSFFLLLMKPAHDQYGNTWNSPLVNRIARSVFPVYLLHENAFISGRMYSWIWRHVFADAELVFLILRAVAVSGVVFSICIAIDFLLRPLHVRLADAIAKVMDMVFLRVRKRFSILCESVNGKD